VPSGVKLTVKTHAAGYKDLIRSCKTLNIFNREVYLL